MNTLGAPFVLEGLFGEADAEAMDAEPDSGLAADAMGMDVEDDAVGTAATADGGMIVDDDGAPNHMGKMCVFHPTYPRLETVKKVYRTAGSRPRYNKKQTQTQTSSLARQYRRTCGSRRSRVRFRDDAGAETSTPHRRAQRLASHSSSCYTQSAR